MEATAFREISLLSSFFFFFLILDFLLFTGLRQKNWVLLQVSIAGLSWLRLVSS